MTKEEQKRLQEIHRTHVFLKWNPEWQRHRDIFDFFREDGTIKDDEEAEKERFVLYKIFQPIDPEKPYAEEYYTKTILHKYFKEMLNLGFDPNPQSIRLWYNKIIAEKQIFVEINRVIDEHGFQSHRAFFLYLISHIQDYFTKSVFDFTQGEKAAQIRKIEKEGKKLEQIMDWYTDKSWEKNQSQPKPRPTSISVTYPSSKEYPSQKTTITDPFLIHHILEGTKKDLEHEPVFGWRLGIKRSVSAIKADEEKLYFKERLVSALHHFLTEEHFFKLEANKKTSDQEIRFIAEVLKFSLVADWEPEKDQADLVRQLRNYINPKRDKLQRVPDYMEVAPKEFDNLLKFFPAQFLNMCSLEKDMPTLLKGTTLIERFELQSKGAEVIHILGCFGNALNAIESDFWTVCLGLLYVPKIQAFFEFLNLNCENVRPGKLTGIKFQKEGHEGFFEITDPEPLALIQKALREYLRAFPEDVSNDVAFVEHKVDPVHGYLIGPVDSFRPSGERFFPWFCKHFYEYLEAQFPKEGYLPKIAEERKEIIALTILLFQNHQFLEPEKFTDMYFKVENWIYLSGLSVPTSGIRV